MSASLAPPAQWLDAERVDALSSRVGDSPELAHRRREALREFLELPIEPNPLYRKYGYFGGVDLSRLDPIPSARGIEEAPAESGAVRVVHDATGTRVAIPESLASLGVLVRTLPELLKEGGTRLDEFVRSAPAADDRLTALSTALINRGYLLEVPARVGSAIAVHDITVLSRPDESLSVRRVVHVGSESQLFATEEVYSTEPTTVRQRLYGSQTEIRADADARVASVSVHAPDDRLVSLYSRRAEAGQNVRLDWVWVGLGGFRTRVRNHTRLVGAGADVQELQTFFGEAEQSYDSAVQLTHIGTDTHGQSITRGVFRDSARGMSRGLVRIEHDARRTLSYLSEHAMLLSKQSRSDTIPILEILCRDVKATHSSSVAPVDPEKVFYLESRGFSESDAVRAISEGFLAYVLDRAPIADLRDIVYPHLAKRWERAPITWSHGSLPARPFPELETGRAGSEWRFDSKLR